MEIISLSASETKQAGQRLAEQICLAKKKEESLPLRVN